MVYFERLWVTLSPGCSAHEKSGCQGFRFRLVTRTPSRASWELSLKLLERLWGCPGTHLESSWPLFAHPGRPWMELGPSFGCPKTVPNASGGVPKTILGAQDGTRSSFRRCWHDLVWISDDFRPIFRRFSVEPLATKPQNRRLEKKSCDPRCPT